MVSRRSRSYKDKGYMAAFGQFMLPLAVVMAIALLYFSMKLFFLPPSGTGRNGATAPAVVSADASAPIQPAVNTPPPQTAQATPPPATAAQTQGTAGSKPAVIAGPVGSTPQSTTTKPAVTQPVKPPTTANTSQPTATKPAATTTTTTATKPATTTAATTTPAAAATQRYDVQIGAFSSKENAQQLLQKARGQGHDVYINEAVHNGAPYFRVRVKGPAQRAEAQTLSAKLQEQDYPVYIVPIAK